MRALVLVAPWVVVLVACSDLPDVPSAECGNHVVEKGEDCDAPGASCGQPGTAAACRFVCAAGGGCAQPGYACGRDGVCRAPSGTYTLAAPIGAPGDRFELADVDGDGLPDVAERGYRELTMWRNDGKSLTRFAAGTATPDLTVARGLAVGRFASSDTAPIAAVVAGETIDFYAITPAHLVTPLVTATVVVPGQQTRDFVGAVGFGDGSVAAPVFFEPGAVELVAYDPLGKFPELHASLAACGATTSSTVEVVPGAPVGGAATRLAVIVDKTTLCVATASEDSQLVRHLDVTPLDMTAVHAWASAYNLWSPVFADIDADGALDIVAVEDRTTAGQPDDYFVVWRGDGAGGFGPATIGTSYPNVTSELFVVGDFNRDRYDDLADLNEVLFNDHTAATFHYTDDENLLTNIVNYGPARTVADVNGDGVPDVALAPDTGGVVSACIFDGKPQPGATCMSVDTGLDAIAGLVGADVNGDLADDLVALGAQPVGADGGVAPAPLQSGTPRLSVVFGRGHALPDPTAAPLAAYHADPVGIAASPAPQLTLSSSDVPPIASELLVILQSASDIGVALGRPVPGAPPAFGVPMPAFEARYAGGATPTLDVLRCDPSNADSELDDDCKVVHFTGGDGAFPFAAGETRAFDRKLPSGDDAFSQAMRLVEVPDDPAPAVVWIESDALVIGHAAQAGYTFATAPAPSGVSLDGLAWWEPADVDGAADPAGDGRNELVLQTVDNGTCRVLVARFARGAATPTITVAATVPGCLFGQRAQYSLDYAIGAPFFVGGDLYATTRDGADAHLARYAGHGDGTWDATPVVDPPLFRAAAGADPSPLAAPETYRWLATADMNGDGVADLVFTTRDGVVVALADTREP